MGEKSVHLKVSTPYQTVLDIDTDFVLLRTVEGDMGILHGHEPCAVKLDYGLLHTTTDKKPSDTLAVLGGFAMVADNQVIVLSELAEYPDRIAEAIADRERERTENKLNDRIASMELQRAEVALRHILVGLDISSYSILKGNEEKTE